MFANASDTRIARVKICGITNATDATLAIDVGADALGFNYYPKSTRCLDTGQDLSWLRELEGTVPRVAVLVNPTREEIDTLLGQGNVDFIQLHGDETPAFCSDLANDGVPFAKALRVRPAEVPGVLSVWQTRWLVLDTFSQSAYGGTGKTLDWSLAQQYVAEGNKSGCHVILSGGLTPANVTQAIEMARPFGVDVASGVELPGSPRRKDAALLRDFVAAAKSSLCA